MGKCSWRQKGTKAKILEEKTKTSQEGVLPKKKKGNFIFTRISYWTEECQII